MRKTLFIIFALVSAGVSASAVETKTWQHATEADFVKGTLDKLSLRSDGRLFLAPKCEQVLDSSLAVLWAVAADSKGNLYVGGGGPGSRAAKLFRVTPSGKAETLAELQGLQVQAIAVNEKDEVFAATSPDGKVYRISAAGGSELFYDPQVNYIWAMVFNSRGELYLGTGDAGEIYRVSSDGRGSVFFKTGETHVRSLAVDASDNLIAGTEPAGLILRISPAGKAFVLYQSSKSEITSVAVAPDGAIYAAGVGAKKPARRVPLPAQPVPATPKPSLTAPAAQSPSVTTTVSVTPVTPVTVSGLRTRITGGSEVYRIEPDGSPHLVWSHKEQIVYSIAIDSKGRAVIGTGNEGRIYRLDSDHLSTLLVKLPPSQVTEVRAGAGGGLYAVTGNIGKLYSIGPQLEDRGTFTGEVLDAGRFSYWGRLKYRGRTAGGRITVETRSGNLNRPQQNWSEWSPVNVTADGGRVTAPPARFLQYRLTLVAGEAADVVPEVSSVEISYLNKNVAPVVRKIAATPPNYRFPPQTLTLTKTKNLTLPPLGGAKQATTPKPITTTRTLSMQYAKGYIGARWLAEDDNDDELTYKVEIRGEQETEWKLLKDHLKDAYLSWDSTAYPDGEYRLRVTASDAPDNPPREALTASLEGEPFLVDNTAPAIENLEASMSGGRITAQWRAVDTYSTIRRAEYSLDGGEWTLVEPVTKLSDAPQLDYRLSLDNVSPGEHTMAVRVEDLFENQAVAKVVVR